MKETVLHAHSFIAHCTMAGLLSLQQVEEGKTQQRCMTTPMPTNGRQVCISLFLICNFDLISIFFFSFWLQLEAYQLHMIPIFKEQKPCHPQLVMEPICKMKNSCTILVAPPAPAIGVKWPNNCLHQSGRQLWCISLTASPAPTDPKKQMIAKKKGTWKKEESMFFKMSTAASSN